MDSMLHLLLGNLCSVLAMVSDCVASTRKTAKGMLFVQSVSQFIYLIGTIVLKGYSGAVQNAVGILRNLAAIKNIDNRWVTWSLVGVGAAVGIWVNNLGLVGYLPIAANVQYTIGVFRFKENERALKYSFLVMVALFAIFNTAIRNYAGTASNLVIIATTVITLLKGRTHKAAERSEDSPQSGNCR